MRKAVALLILVLPSALVLGGASTAYAEETVCDGSFGATTVDNLRVPEGRSCTLQGTTVQGTIKVESNATLRAIDVTVIGNVQGENAERVVVKRGSSIGGDVQVVQGQSARVAKSAVEGDILYDENTAKLVAKRNTIGGDVQAFQNTGGVKIRGNEIDGNLQCKENTPAPVGGDNIVHGNKEDQCSAL